MRLLPIFLLACTGAHAQTWVAQAPLPAAARQAPSSFVIDGLAYVVGGWDFSTYYTELWMYDPALEVWEEKAPLPGPGWKHVTLMEGVEMQVAESVPPIVRAMVREVAKRFGKSAGSV